MGFCCSPDIPATYTRSTHTKCMILPTLRVRARVRVMFADCSSARLKLMSRRQRCVGRNLGCTRARSARHVHREPSAAFCVAASRGAQTLNRTLLENGMREQGVFYVWCAPNLLRIMCANRPKPPHGGQRDRERPHICAGRACARAADA